MRFRLVNVGAQVVRHARGPVLRQSQFLVSASQTVSRARTENQKETENPSRARRGGP